MKYAIVSGSTRERSQSSKVANWLCDEINKENTAEVIDLYNEKIPVWDDSAWKADSELSKVIKPYRQQIQDADGIILVSPEWHGMVPGGLKNFLLYISSKQAAHKPCLLVGVSSGKGGTYPIAELRMSGYKNNRMLYIPDHLIVRDVENVMNTHDLENAQGEDHYIQKRALYSLNALYVYASALKTMRETHDLLDEEYPFGM